VQHPAAEHVPPADSTTDAEDAIEFASAYGLTPDPWQEHVLRSWLGTLASGQLAAPRAGLAVPRQNGKNALIEVVELFKTVVQGRRVLHTAHEVKTARKAFARLKFFFGDRVNDPAAQYPELNNLVREVRNTNGQEAIVLSNGGQVEFIARSRSSGRGFPSADHRAGR
jgi:phage terminase large subunit-like protein